jgi:hypothetical protein
MAGHSLSETEPTDVAQDGDRITAARARMSAALQLRRTSDLSELRASAAALIAAIDHHGGSGDDGDRRAILSAAGIDPDVFCRLLALTGEEIARDLLARLDEDLAAARADLAGTSHDKDRVRQVSHLLIGLAGSVGAVDLHDAAEGLNRAARDGDAPDPTGVMRAIDVLRAFLARHGGDLPDWAVPAP